MPSLRRLLSRDSEREEATSVRAADLCLAVWNDDLLSVGTILRALDGNDSEMIRVLNTECNRTLVPSAYDISGTPLVIAARLGYCQITRFLLSAARRHAWGNVDIVNAEDSNRFSPLMWAACKGDVDTVKLLAKSGLPIRVNKRDTTLRTPLHGAAAGGHCDVIKALLELPADLDRPGRIHTDSMPHCWPMDRGYASGFRFLANAHYVDPDILDGEGLTPLALAACHGHHDAVRLFLETGIVDPDRHCNDPTDADQTILMRMAILSLNPWGSPFHSATMFSRTIDRVGLRSQYSLIADSLVKTCQIDLSIYGPRQLSHFVAAEFGELARRLLETGRFDPNELIYQDSSKMNTSLLQVAVGQGSEKMVQLLLDTGRVDPNKPGGTPLYVATMRGFINIMQLLLAAGADPDKAKSSGDTPLFGAAHIGYLNLISMLKAKANPNKHNSDGKTPTHVAARMGHSEAARLLLEAESLEREPWTPRGNIIDIAAGMPPIEHVP